MNVFLKTIHIAAPGLKQPFDLGISQDVIAMLLNLIFINV